MAKPYIDSRGPLHVALDNLIVIGRYLTLREAEDALADYIMNKDKQDNPEKNIEGE